MPTPQSRSRTCAALCFLAAVTPADAPAAPEIRYREAWGFGVVVPVYVQGVGPFEFLLDTGADSTVIHPDLAQRLELKPSARVELMTLAGPRLVPLTTVSALRLGQMELGIAEVLVHDMSAARAADARLDGILGRNALRDTTFTIDHRRRRVVFESAPADWGVPYHYVDGRPVVEATLCGRGEPMRMALDSGVGGVVLFERSPPLPVATAEVITARTNAGPLMLRGGRLEALCLGPARLRDVPVAIRGREAAEGRPEDGLLPTGLFARVQFDAARRTVRVDPW
jgi:hypothetical protein